MAQLKLRQYAAARDDAARAIALDPTYVKALSRRAAACAELGELQQAIRDWEAIVRLEPKNKKAREEIKALRQRQEAEEAERRRSFNPLKAAEAVGQRNALPARKPLVRIPIQEMGVALDSVRPTAENAKVPETPAAQTAVSVTDKAVKAPGNATTFLGSKPTPSKPQAMATGQQTAEATRSAPSLVQELPLTQAVLRTAAVQPVSVPKASPKTGAPPAAPPPAAAMPVAHPPPSAVTPYVFETTWQRLQEQPAELASFLQTLEPKRICAHLAHSFDAPVLSTMLTLLRDYYLPAGVPVAPLLWQLTKVTGEEENAVFHLCL